jgi:hypothetical protein
MIYFTDFGSGLNGTAVGTSMLIASKGNLDDFIWMELGMVLFVSATAWRSA